MSGSMAVDERTPLLSDSSTAASTYVEPDGIPEANSCVESEDSNEPVKPTVSLVAVVSDSLGVPPAVGAVTHCNLPRWHL